MIRLRPELHQTVTTIPTCLRANLCSTMLAIIYYISGFGIVFQFEIVCPISLSSCSRVDDKTIPRSKSASGEIFSNKHTKRPTSHIGLQRVQPLKYFYPF